MYKRTASLLLLSLLAAGPVLADEYGRHPMYLHALTDLRTAQWEVDHRRPEDGAISADESIVHDEIGAAIHDLERAAWQDGKGSDWQPPPDVGLKRDGRLHAAIDLMRKAESDVARQEDDPRSRPFQQHGLEHLQAALEAAHHAIGDVHWRDDRRQ